MQQENFKYLKIQIICFLIMLLMGCANRKLSSSSVADLSTPIRSHRLNGHTEALEATLHQAEARFIGLRRFSSLLNDYLDHLDCTISNINQIYHLRVAYCTKPASYFDDQSLMQRIYYYKDIVGASDLAYANRLEEAAAKVMNNTVALKLKAHANKIRIETNTILVMIDRAIQEIEPYKKEKPIMDQLLERMRIIRRSE